MKRIRWLAPPLPSGPYPFTFAHVIGYGHVPPLAALESHGWVKVGEVPGLAGVWVMERDAIAGND